MYEGWFEDFHPMDYGRRPDELRSTLETRTRCSVTYRPEGTITIDTLTLDRYRYELSCRGRISELSYLAYRGMILRELGQARVYKLVRASGGP